MSKTVDSLMDKTVALEEPIACAIADISLVPDSQPTSLEYIWCDDDGEDETESPIDLSIIQNTPSQKAKFSRKRAHCQAGKKNRPRTKAAKRLPDLDLHLEETVDEYGIPPQTLHRGANPPSACFIGRVCYIDNLTKSSAATPSGRHGTTFLCSDPLRQSFNTHNKLFMQEGAKLFFEIGAGIYLDNPHTSSFSGNHSKNNLLRLGLWKVNNITKFQRIDSRYSVTLDFNAIHQIKSALPDIENALKISDSETFLGYALNLDRNWFLSVEKDDCNVNIRYWVALKSNQQDPEAELIAGREGLRLNYEQFKKFRLFMEKHLEEYYPTFKNHVFKCDKPDHDVSQCKICRPHGRLPLHKYDEKRYDR